MKLITLFLFLSSFTVAQKDSLTFGKCINDPDIYNNQQVYRIAEKMPEFEGGINEFYKYIAKTFRHTTCRDFNDHKSKIYSTFIIDTLGQLQNICTITRDANLNDDEKQLQEIIKQSVPWKPGIQDGKKVCVRITVPMWLCLR